MRRISDLGRGDSAHLASLMRDRIHYGCGRRILEGWLNVDGFDESYPVGAPDESLAARIFCCDLAGRHPFPDGCFRFGFAEDFLEHLEQWESLFFLEEACRTLVPGGVLRLSFPGLEGVLRRHFSVPAPADYERGVHDAYGLWGHRHFHCWESLALAARRAGFQDVKRVAYGDSVYPELCGLDSRADQKDINIYAELTKPVRRQE